MPLQMEIKSPVAEARNEYTYSATGQKLKVVQKWNPSYSTAPVIGSGVNSALLTASKTTDYVGNKIYENGTLAKILTDNGYYDNSEKKYYFYVKNHLGSNQAVADADGYVSQNTFYYPFGLNFTMSTGQARQPYKYNGKELDMMHGLNQYDYEARYYDPSYGRFTTIDPLAEKYYSISPYAYCANNPVRYIDPDGRDIRFRYVDEGGKERTWIFNGVNQDKAPKDQFISDFLSAYSYNIENGGGDKLQEAASATEYTIDIVQTENGSRNTQDNSLHITNKNLYICTNKS